MLKHTQNLAEYSWSAKSFKPTNYTSPALGLCFVDNVFLSLFIFVELNDTVAISFVCLFADFCLLFDLEGSLLFLLYICLVWLSVNLCLFRDFFLGLRCILVISFFCFVIRVIPLANTFVPRWGSGLK